jgi:hypothetical protein
MHDQTVWQRFMNGFHRLRFRLAQVAVLKDINQIRVQNGLPKIVSKDDIYGKSLVLVNSIFGIDYPRTISPLFKMVGLLQSPSIKREALAVGLQTWLDSDETPVIFVSFPSEIPLSEKSFDTLVSP